MEQSTKKPSNLVESLERSRKKFADNPIFATKMNGQYRWIDYKEFGSRVDHMRGGLAQLGIKKGDKVAIIARNSVEWAVAAYASYSLGAVFVPMYENQTAADWKYIIRDSHAKVVFSWEASIHRQIVGMIDEIADLQWAININGDKKDSDTYDSLIEIGKTHPVEPYFPNSEDLMGLIYTSGTTGNPKGVMLSHGNILSNCYASAQMFSFAPGDVTLSFLPWAHIFGQVGELHMLIYLGFATGFAEGVHTITDNLSEIKPTVLMAVPRIFNRIYDGVNAKMKDKGGPIAALFYKGLELQQSKKEGSKLSLKEKVLLGIAQKVVFAKVRQAFGGKLRYAISGAAALDPKVAHFVDNLGIVVFEGYGLSETSPMISANRLGAVKIGSVGQLIPEVKVVIDTSVASGKTNEGEIIAYGPNIMQGYHNLPDETKKVMTDDGGFRTGDLGRLDQNGYLHITGRIKEQYKLENGKYVVPSPLEESLKLSPYIENAFIFGENRKHNVCLIGVNLEAVKNYAARKDIHDEDLLSNHEIRSLFAKELKKYKGPFKEYEVPKNFTLISEEWTPDNGFLTPSLKVKRRVVLERYESQITGLYDS